MNNTITKERRAALLMIVFALVLQAIAWNMLASTYGWTQNQTLEGAGLLVGPIGFIFWVAGFVKYSRTKGRSDLLAIFLCLFGLLGFIILLLLTDLRKKKASN